MDIRKVGLLDSMRVSERENLCIAEKTDFVNSFSIMGKMNPVGFLDSTQAALT